MSYSELMKPDNLEEFVGNENIFNPETGAVPTIYRLSIENKTILPSLILHGPPGTGKTAFASFYGKGYNEHLLLNKIQPSHAYIYKTFNSGEFNKKELLEFIESIGNKNNTEFLQTKYIPLIFIDEFHMMNSTQQGILLSSIESEEIVFVGATTESLGLRAIEGLRSRCRILEFSLLSPHQTLKLLINALNHIPALKTLQILQKEALALISAKSAGDGRVALTLLENSVIDNQLLQKNVETALTFVNTMNYNSKELYYDGISALQKSIRASDPNGAIFYLAMLLKIDADPLAVMRRLLVMSAEDVGLADPSALILANSTLSAFQQIGMPEGKILMAELVVYLANAPKSNASYMALDNANKWLSENNNEELWRPRESYRKSTAGPEYVYPHEFGGYVLDSALPEHLQSVRFYEPDEVRQHPVTGKAGGK